MRLNPWTKLIGSQSGLEIFFWDWLIMVSPYRLWEIMLYSFVIRANDVVIHTSMLFFQVVTLNVAVNSYSNALLSLLMSNQFVEIKGTVFKKFEKENLFQMACAG